MSAAIHPALKRFIWDIQSMVELTDDAREILFIGADLMARLLAAADWLDAGFAAPTPEGPRQVQLFGDEAERFCVVASVLAGGQALPVLLDPYWQLTGVVAGQVTLEKIAGSDGEAVRALEAPRTLGPGAVERFAPKAGEALRLSNASPSNPAIAIHVYGAEVGARPRYDISPEGRLVERAFGYANGADAPAYDIWSIQTKIED